jgi:hypothetical protein
LDVTGIEQRFDPHRVAPCRLAAAQALGSGPTHSGLRAGGYGTHRLLVEPGGLRRAYPAGGSGMPRRLRGRQAPCRARGWQGGESGKG